MGHPDRHPCAWARQKLDEIIELDRNRRDALPGSFMKLIKAAKKVLVKRHRDQPDNGPKAED